MGAFGDNTHGQCNVPTLPHGARYISVAAGSCHTVLLRSDGDVVAFGDNCYGLCNVPALPPGTHYMPDGEIKLEVWNPEAHKYFPSASRAVVKTLLLIQLRLQKHEEAVMIPLDIILNTVIPFMLPAALVRRSICQTSSSISSGNAEPQ